MISYNETISVIRRAIRYEISKNLSVVKTSDGRLDSAVNENMYLRNISHFIQSEYTNIDIVVPNVRFWYDIKINNIPFNLKLSSGGTDNAFSKSSIIYTLLGTEYSKKVNYNDWINIIKNGSIKKTRNRLTEYHYITIFKNSGDFLVKSLIDIHTYKSNPSNILQINWKNELKNEEYETINYSEKIKEMLKTVQNSILIHFNNSNTFLNEDFSFIDL